LFDELCRESCRITSTQNNRKLFVNAYNAAQLSLVQILHPENALFESGKRWNLVFFGDGVSEPSPRKKRCRPSSFSFLNLDILARICTSGNSNVCSSLVTPLYCWESFSFFSLCLSCCPF